MAIPERRKYRETRFVLLLTQTGTSPLGFVVSAAEELPERTTDPVDIAMFVNQMETRHPAAMADTALIVNGTFIDMRPQTQQAEEPKEQ